MFSLNIGNKKDGHTNKCKSCVRDYYLANKEEINAKCTEKYNSLSKQEKEERQKNAHKRYLDNKEYWDKYYKEYYQKNKEKWKKYNTEEKRQYLKEYYIKNIEYHRKKNIDRRADKLEWLRNKLMTDPKCRINRNIGSAIRRSTTGKGGVSWQKLVGYTAEELHNHLESLFVDGMSWDNYKHGKIHIDHVIPLSWFHYKDVNDPEFKKAWALENLQPLWAIDNLRKGNSYAGRPNGNC